MARLSEEKINQILESVDIVDVISMYLNVEKKVAIIKRFVRFMMILILHYLFPLQDRFINALFVEQAEMLLPFYKSI